MTVVGLQLPPEGSLYPTTTLLDWHGAAAACSLHLLRQNHLLQMDTSNMSGLRYREMRDATMRATRDYSPHKVAESVQGGEGQFLELWRLRAAGSIVMVDRPCGIRMDILQDPSTTRHVKKHRSYPRGAPTN